MKPSSEVAKRVTRDLCTAPFARFTQSHRTGAAAMENMLILGAILLCLAALLAGLHSQRGSLGLALLSDQGGFGSVDVTGSNDVYSSSSPRTNENETARDTSRATDSRLLATLALSAGAVGLVAFHANRLRRKRRRMPIAVTPETDPVPSAPLAIRALVKRQQLWRALLTDGELLLRNGLEVRHLMTREPLSVAPHTPICEVEQLMENTGVHHMLVCEGDTLLGVISDRDLCGCSQRNARDVMTKEIVTIAPGAGIGTAIQTLLEKRISCLPVVDQNRLCGLISTTDLALALQCSLQLWLRMAQSMRSGAAWVAALEGVTRAVAQGESAQATQLAELRSLLPTAVSGDRPEMPAAFVTKAEEFLAATSALSSRIAKARDDLNGLAEKWIGLNDLRTDEITGLANHRELTAVLELLLAVRRRYQQPFTLVTVTIAPRRGVIASGTQGVESHVLLDVVKFLVASLRSSDFLARTDALTFAAVLTQTSMQGADVFCDRLRKATAERFAADLSIAVTATESVDDDNPSSLLARGTLLAP